MLSKVTKTQTILALLEYYPKDLLHVSYNVIIGLTDLFIFHSVSWHIICLFLFLRYYDLLMNFLNLEIELFSFKEGEIFLFVFCMGWFFHLLLASLFSSQELHVFRAGCLSILCFWLKRVGLLSPNQWLIASCKIIWSTQTLLKISLFHS